MSDLKKAKIKGWGNKFSGKRAQLLANIFNFGYELKEDGFIAYIERNGYKLSTVSDRHSVYYQASKNSNLVDLIISKLTPMEAMSCERLITSYKQNTVSKYNSEREFKGTIPGKYILLVDQVYGDLSVKYGSSGVNSFRNMLDDALNKFPDHKILIKVHPDVYSRKKRGYFDLKKIIKNPRIQIIAENCHPTRLIQNADSVYTVTSQIGFEALIYGKPVKCFGAPFYSGWGLTEDVLPSAGRRENVSLEQLVYAVLVKYPKYRDPETGERTTADKIVEYVGFQRMMRFRFPEKIYAYGFSKWKQPILKSFTQGSEVIFIKQLSKMPCRATLLVWGSKELGRIDLSINVVRVEDGFLRSVGLGGELIRPQSWVFDQVGIYYDSRKPSQLENLLNVKRFEKSELNQADRLIQIINDNKISKYNLGDSDFSIDSCGEEIALVIGQVEGDASIRFSTTKINTNLKLLKIVRANFPNAYIVYKPHPDIVAGIRRKGVHSNLEKEFYDYKVESGDAITLFDSVDTVHTMTSLTGFEALIRKKKVYTYGKPFYAGWGLTNDLMNFKSRSRVLSLSKLVYGALVCYPSYISSNSKMYSSPESVIGEIILAKEKGVEPRSFKRKIIRDLMRLWAQSKFRNNA